MGQTDDPHDVPQSVTANRVPRVVAFAAHLVDAVHGFLGCEAGFKPLDVAAWRHHGREGAVVQVKHVAHHLVLVFFDETRIHPLDQAGGDFFFRNSAAA